ncbi:MAG: hypothetical protein CMM09_00940 [Rhodospirillaceae bacterium]|nr:hypothetical protein [Rhodospirillaceae bacterium]
MLLAHTADCFKVDMNMMDRCSLSLFLAETQYSVILDRIRFGVAIMTLADGAGGNIMAQA